MPMGYRAQGSSFISNHYRSKRAEGRRRPHMKCFRAQRAGGELPLLSETRITENSTAEPQPPAVASLHNAVKKYGSKTVVDNVSIDVPAGKTTMLVGPNGSGKTTSMEMMVGLRRFTSGSAQICGIDVEPNGAHRLYTGVQLQHSGLPSRIRVNEVLQAVGVLYSDPADPRELVEILGLEHHWKTSVDKLSGGQRRRLDIAAACMGRPKFLLLDEPTSGVDAEGRAELWQFLRRLARQGTGVLASTHDLAEAEAFADRLFVMSKGKIVLEGTPAEVLNSVGGDWRLRIHDAPPQIRELIVSRGLAVTPVGMTDIVVGRRETLEALRAEIETALHDGGSGHVEILSSRIRLEDVFAISTGKGQAS